jgi:hypothetical protein
MSAGRDVAIRIDELVVDGAGGIDRDRLAAAVAAELGRLVGERAIHPATAVHARLDAGSVGTASQRSSVGDASGAVGRRVAQAVHGALGGER